MEQSGVEPVGASLLATRHGLIQKQLAVHRSPCLEQARCLGGWLKAKDMQSTKHARIVSSLACMVAFNNCWYLEKVLGLVHVEGCQHASSPCYPLDCRGGSPLIPISSNLRLRGRILVDICESSHVPGAQGGSFIGPPIPPRPQVPRETLGSHQS